MKLKDKKWSATISQTPRLEGFALALAGSCGIEVPVFRLETAGDEPVLLLRRFDRSPDGSRVHVLSARTLLGIPEASIDLDGSYPALAELLRRVGQTADSAARWFERMVFNIAIGNTDDHPLNHLFGWDGRALSLMPAFDLEPCGGRDQHRHQMRITPDSFVGSHEQALSICAEFGLNRSQAGKRIDHIRNTIRDKWLEIAGNCGCSSDSIATIRHSLVL